MSSTPPPHRTRPDPLVGTVLGAKFRVLELVASGGMGRIYRGEQLTLGRTVALKVLHVPATDDEDTGGDPQLSQRFLREASILARLQHPNIVTVFDYGEIEGPPDGRYFIALEFLTGETLAQRIARSPLGVADTVRIARQIARGLSEAHANGVVHRDLKPSNVMLVPGRDGEEHVKIVDFGIVKILGEVADDQELTQEGTFIGSPKYMAPEQIGQGSRIDGRTDMYAFGVIVYECLTGSVPFLADSSSQMLMAHLNQAPRPLRAVAPDLEVPAWLEQLVMACLEKEREHRPASMEAVGRLLGEAQQGAPSASWPVPAPAASPALTSSGPPRAAGGVTEQGTTASLGPPRPSTGDPAGRDAAIASRAGRARTLWLVAGLTSLGLAAFIAQARRPTSSAPPATSPAAQPSRAPSPPATAGADDVRADGGPRTDDTLSSPSSDGASQAASSGSAPGLPFGATPRRPVAAPAARTGAGAAPSAGALDIRPTR